MNSLQSKKKGSFQELKKRGTYLDQEEVDSEGGKASCKLDVLVLGVDLGGAHQRLVVHEDLLLHVLHLHEPEREELFQAREETHLSWDLSSSWYILFSFVSPILSALLFFSSIAQETIHLRLVFRLCREGREAKKFSLALLANN